MITCDICGKKEVMTGNYDDRVYVHHDSANNEHIDWCKDCKEKAIKLVKEAKK